MAKLKIKRGYTLSAKGRAALIKSLKARNYNKSSTKKTYPTRHIKRIG